LSDIEKPSIAGVLRYRRIEVRTLSQGFLGVILKSDDSLKGIAEKLRMFFIVGGRKKLRKKVHQNLERGP
jgi:hypothetical protein